VRLALICRAVGTVVDINFFFSPGVRDYRVPGCQSDCTLAGQEIVRRDPDERPATRQPNRGILFSSGLVAYENSSPFTPGFNCAPPW
jgi:hypothetical protein